MLAKIPRVGPRPSSSALAGHVRQQVCGGRGPDGVGDHEDDPAEAAGGHAGHEGLGEQQGGLQVRDGRVAWYVEQEPAAVAGVSSAPFGRFQDQDATPGVVGGDGRGGPGRAVPGDHHVRHRRAPSLSARESNFRCYSSR
jgi:hypothetical protein